jgi:hypothetical protein
VGCGEEVVIPLGALDPVECDGCGLDYDPRTGEALPVCDGFLAAYVTPVQAM